MRALADLGHTVDAPCRDPVLLEAGVLDARADLDVGAVWLGSQPAIEEFDLRAFRPS